MSQRFVFAALLLAFAAAACADGADDGVGGSGNSTVNQSGGGGSEHGGAPPLGGAGGTESTTGGTGGGGAPPTNGGMGGTGGSEDGGMAEGGAGGGPIVDTDLYPLETENNGSLVNANLLPEDALGFQAELPSANDVDVFAITIPLGSSMRVAVSDGQGGCPGDANVSIQIYAPDNLTVLGSASGLCPVLDGNTSPALGTITAAGTYFARVATAASVDFYVLELSATPPECGDGIPQLGEQCDDGNMTAGDGCENDCTETAICGDGSLQGDEACDDGNQIDTDGCNNACQFLSCTGGQSLVNYTATGLPLNITDNTTITSTINVPVTGTVTKLVVSIDIDHTYDGDLSIALDGPAAPVVDLSSGNGAGGDNYRDTVFSSLASAAITMGAPPYTGIFLPEASFATVLNTAVNGNWVLSVSDNAGGDFGTLNRFKLSMCVAP